MSKQDKKIPLVECFGPTIQGEGAHIGQQTFFLRFGLCDYSCKMCDSMHAVDPAQVKIGAKWLTQEEIADTLENYTTALGPNWVTFSGGNPCIHDLSLLVDILHERGYLVAVETQGTLKPEWLKKVDSITVAPKGPGMGERFDWEQFKEFLPLAPYIKFVVFDQRDLDFARDVISATRDAVAHELDFSYRRIFLSLGNPVLPSTKAQLDPVVHQQMLLHQYRVLFDDIKQDAYLSKVKFLPQWHVFVFGNDKGH